MDRILIPGWSSTDVRPDIAATPVILLVGVAARVLGQPRRRSRSGRGVAGTLALLLLLGCGRGETGQPEDTSWQAQLEALGYVNSVPVEADAGGTGVTIFDPSAVYPGLNLFNSRHESVAKLMTMDGRVVHRWQSEAQGATVASFKKALPTQRFDHLDGWNHVELLPSGDLLVIGSHHMLLRLDWDSNIVWKLDLSAHHDLAVASNGDIHVLSDGIRTARAGAKAIAFQDIYIVTVSPDGKIRGRFSLYDAFERNRDVQRKLASLRREQVKSLESLENTDGAGADYRKLLMSAIRGNFEENEDVKNLLFLNRTEDIFHANSIQLLTEHPPLWREGDFLITIRGLDMIVVIDHETKRLKWKWGQDELEQPHHATQLPDGGILVFDNGVRRGYSRILKFDPRTLEIVWSYQANPPTSFFSLARGGAQELPNGNLLITESDEGRAFELTPEGEIAWEFFDDVWRDDDGEDRRGTIYRMTRLDTAIMPDHVEPREE